MSKRERLTRRQPKKSTRQSNWYERTADPLMMNQERTHVPTEEYMIGDPSSWAEDPVDDLSHMDGTDRDEIGLPKREDRSAREAQVRLAKMQRHFEKKALHCVRIAEVLLPNASEDVIAEQALDFMPMPDDAVMETAARLKSLGIFASDEEEEEKADKEANLSTDEMLRIMEAEKAEKEEKDEEEDEAKEAGEDGGDDAADDAGDEAEAKEAGDDGGDDAADEAGDDAEAEEGGDKEASEYLDEDLDAMLADMEGGDINSPTAELGIDLEPQLDALDSEALLGESDDTLQALMNQQYAVNGPQAKTASTSQKKVNQLGRVKESGAAGSGDNLEGLWDRAPDVSKVFS